LRAVVSAGFASINLAIIAWPAALALAVAGLLAMFWPQISNFFVNLWSGILAKLSELWNGIANFLKNHWQDLLLWILS
jgi:uncharacterized membrane protein HdeD (DUF308 family)